MSHASMEKLKVVETLILFLAKIISLPYKIKKYPCTEKWAHETSSFPKDSSPGQALLGMRNLSRSHKQSSVLPLIVHSNFGFSFPSSIPENIWRAAFKNLSMSTTEGFA